jgi:hypothetical protein
MSIMQAFQSIMKSKSRIYVEDENEHPCRCCHGCRHDATYRLQMTKFFGNEAADVKTANENVVVCKFLKIGHYKTLN